MRILLINMKSKETILKLLKNRFAKTLLTYKITTNLMQPKGNRNMRILLFLTVQNRTLISSLKEDRF